MNALRGVVAVVATWLIYLGVPLLGWGLGDLSSFPASAARIGLAIVTLAFGLAVGVQALSGWEGIRAQGAGGDKRVRRQTIVRLLVVLFMYVGLFLLPFADRRGLGVLALTEAGRWVGVVFSALGFTLVFLSGLHLGRQYSPEVTIQADHQLVTDGPYRVLRHPRYLGVLLLAVGESMAFRSLAGVIASIGLLAVLLFRIRDEEILMEKEFGAAWQAYRRRSWRLMPYIY